MADYTVVHLEDVDDAAAAHGMQGLEARFARTALGLRQSGVTYFRFAPGFRQPFGHRHREQEEVYVVLSGSLRVKVEDEVVELGPLDALRLAPDTTRAVVAGRDGAEMLAIGAPAAPDDGEILPGWWAQG